MRRILFSLLTLAALCGVANAQVVTQTSPSRADSGVLVSSTAPAVNATVATGTVTITPPAGQYVHFTGINVAACGDGTASTSSIQQNFTTTNLSSLTIETSYLSAATITSNAGASQCDRVVLPFTTPLRSAAAGTAVTIVPPAQAAHMSFPIIATYYFAP
jgi:hypothetical protein